MMDLPQPPHDQDLRNIIDKLAQFVARNGPEFEKMTKNKQKNNPKFGFLYGGEYFNYYQYKVTTEQAILKQGSGPRGQSGPNAFAPQTRQYNVPQQGPGGSEGAGGGGLAALWLARAGGPARPDLEAIAVQQAALQEQIKQSESNLSAQHSVLIQQQQSKIDETVNKAQTDLIQKLADENNVNLAELDSILQPIIDSCTKDSILAGKGWILSHATTPDSGTAITQYLLKKATQSGAAFTQKLHIIYLVNDVLHHCARKNADDLKKSLENVVVPMFCNASIAVTEEQEAKLNKLLKLWGSKSNYLEEGVMEKMKTPTASWRRYQDSLLLQHQGVIAPLQQQTKTTMDGYQTQHQAFVAHSLQQLQQLGIQKQALEQPHIINPQDSAENTINTQFTSPFPNQIFPINTPFDQNFPNNINPSQSYSENGDYHNSESNTSANDNQEDELLAIPPAVNFSQPPPGFFPEPLPAFQNGLPDLSKPPPGFPVAPEISAEDLMPALPYFELPAGLIVPLIMLEDSEYKPLDPESIRLPPPAPPSDRLLAAVDAFYAGPNHERPRDVEGWEKLGLYEYYKAKNQAKKQKEDDIANGARDKSKSPSPIARDFMKQPSPPGRCYRSRSRTPPPRRSPAPAPPPAPSPRRRDRDTPASAGGGRRRSRSRSPRSRSRSPIGFRNHERRESRGGDRERDRERERDRDRDRDRERDRDRDRERERRREESPPARSSRSRNIHRSPTPPSFLGSTYSNATPIAELDSSNKGHQMLRRMGWGEGGGLGATGQGIQAPISGGEIRDRQDQYKGVGINLNDPYENFRKNRGVAFIARIQERASERA